MHSAFLRAEKISKNCRPFIMKGVSRVLADADEWDTTADIPFHFEKLDARHALNDLDPFHNVSLAEGEDPPVNVHLGDDGEENDAGFEPEDEPRGRYAQFCDMSSRQQAAEVNRLKHLACGAVGLDISDVDFPDSFILDCIQDELTDAEFVEEAMDCYRRSRLQRVNNCWTRVWKRVVLTDEDRALVAKVGKMENHWNYAGNLMDDEPYAELEDDEMALQSACVSRRSDSYTSRRGPRAQRFNRGNPEAQVRGSKRTRCSHNNSESHCPKYGRQDWRHQLPRLEEKHERRLEAWYRQSEYLADEQEIYLHFSEWMGIVGEPEFLSVRDQLLIPDWKLLGDAPLTYADLDEYVNDICQLREKMDDMAHYFGYMSDVADRAGLPGYRPEDSWSRRVRRVRISSGDISESRLDEFGSCHCPICLDDRNHSFDFDTWDDGRDDDRDDGAYDYPELEYAPGWTESRINRLGDDDDSEEDYFSDWLDRHIDAKPVGHSSGKRGSYRYLMSASPRLVLEFSL